MDRPQISIVLSLCAKPIAFHPALSTILGNDIGAALFLQQIIFWSDKGSRGDGWIYKSDRQFEEETTLTPRQSSRIRRILRGQGILDVQVFKAPGGSPTNHYKLNEEILLKRVMDFYKMSESSITEKTTEKKAAPSKEGAAPLTPKRRYKKYNASIDELSRYWIDRCIKELGQEPAFISGASFKRMSEALKKGFSVDEIKEIFDEWFGLYLDPEKQVQMTEALSDKKLLAYRARNPKKAKR